MEIQKTTTGVFYASRIFGLAPYLIQRNSKGRITEIKLSIILCIYSVLALVVTVYMTCLGLFNDAHSKSPTRMKSATSKIVTTIDVIVVVGACSLAVLSGMLGLHYTQDMNRKLREADEVLSLYTDEVKDHRRSIFILVAVYTGITGMLGMDLGSRHRRADKASKSEEADIADVNINGYIPFYILYYILMTLHIQIAHTALGIGRRYRRLNIALVNLFSSNGFEKMTKTNSSVHIIGSTLQNINVSTDNFEMKKASTIIGHVPDSETKNINFIKRLANTHSALGDIIEKFSTLYGLTLLVLLTSCLLQLVSTIYFLIDGFTNKVDTGVNVLLSFWILLHVARLLLIVEPCHVTSIEARKTILLISAINRNNKNNRIRKYIVQFWRQLLSTYSGCSFTAFGMCTIDREILTSLSGAIATYLVILIQLQDTKA